MDLRSIGGSALTDADIAVPTDVDGHIIGQGIPSTYVPARNTIMLSVALGWAEVLGATDLFCGVNAVDYSGYPDCRPEFIAGFEALANLATKAGVEGSHFRVHAPLMRMSKADIAREGLRLGVDFAQTVSCYQADASGLACGHCDACLRAQGFADAEFWTHLLLLPADSVRMRTPAQCRAGFSQWAVSSVGRAKTFNLLVDGSNPSRPTIEYKELGLDCQPRGRAQLVCSTSSTASP